MTTNTQLYKFAEQFIGDGGKVFRKFAGLGGSQPYCAAYVSYIFNKGGAKSLFYGGKTVTYCPNAIRWCRANLAEIPLYLAMQMDIIFFDWQPNGVPDHIGFVKNKISTSTIKTHEGNTSGGIVAEKTRPSKYVLGVFRPHFKGTYKIGQIAVDGDCGYNTIANLQKALKMSFVDGILGKATVKALQKRAGVTADGAWGKKTSKAVQKLIGTKVDGEFGKNSVVALQKWINAQNKVKSSSPSPVKTENKPVQSVSTAKGYSGQFPDLTLHSGQKIAYTGMALAWAKGTPKKTYTYGKGHATLAFQKAINKVYPKRSSWSKQCQAGASCDVGAGTVLRYSGYDPTIPRGLAEQIPHLQKTNLFKKTSLTKTSQMAAGDVGVYIHKNKGAHIWIGIGNKKIVEANHTAKYFLHVDTDNYTSSNKKVWGIYRACLPSAIENGDRGSEVVKMQNFLNWYGGYKLSSDGEVGTKTISAVKDFQKKVGVTADGAFGSASLTKAKAVRK